MASSDEYQHQAEWKGGMPSAPDKPVGTTITTESVIEMIKDMFKENSNKNYEKPLTWSEALRRDELMRIARFDEEEHSNKVFNDKNK